MSHPSETKEEKNIDIERVYCTNALIKKVGGAVAVSLEDATLPGNAKNKHMTILYRRNPKWTEKEIELISKETDAWIKQKYGNNKAPITFTLDKWGNQSCKINGDLNELCLYLRSKCAEMSNDKQRIPHVAIYHGRRNGNNDRRGKLCHICGESGHFRKNCPAKPDKKNRKNDKNDKLCHICGESGHFRKNCPEKREKKNRKKEEKKVQRNSKNSGNNNNKINGTEKVKERLRKMILKTNELKQKKQNEVHLLDDQQIKLQNLLDNADNLDTKTVKNEIKNIAKAFKNKRKEMKGKGHKKCNKNKQDKKNEKIQRKELNKQRKAEKKLAREQRKKLKKEKKEKLLAAQLDTLPSKMDINGSNILYIYVDGYNIIGCDNLCRKSMRGKGGGMKKSRVRLAKLLQELFINKYKNGALKLEYAPIIKLWFDGNGKNESFGDIEITFSTKKQIVDDKLVETFSKNNKKDNANILVITSDRELTLRLDAIGVFVMKSSTFYKTFLKEKDEKNNEKNNDINIDNDEKKEETEPGTNDCENDEFVKIISAKMNAVEYEYEETQSSDYAQIEGENDNTNDMMNDDYEFTSIFGEEDMNTDSN